MISHLNGLWQVNEQLAAKSKRYCQRERERERERERVNTKSEQQNC